MFETTNQSSVGHLGFLTSKQTNRAFPVEFPLNQFVVSGVPELGPKVDAEYINHWQQDNSGTNYYNVVPPRCKVVYNHEL